MSPQKKANQEAEECRIQLSLSELKATWLAAEASGGNDQQTQW